MKKQSYTSNISGRQRGFASITVLILTTVAIVVLLALVSATSTQMKLSAKGQDRVTGAALAEAGIDDAIDKIRLNPDTFIGTKHTAFPDITLYEDPGANVKPQGSFQTDVKYVDDTTRRVVSTGTNANGSKVTIAALVTIEMTTIGNGALIANENVSLSGSVPIATIPSDSHVANVIANQNITMGGGSYVDGELSAGGTISGTGFYPNVTGNEPYPFPSAALTDKWRADAIAQASGGTIYNSVRTSRIITAPAYIRGDISLQNTDTVVLTGTGVVYVEGNVKLTASSHLTNGVTLVVNGTYDQQGQSIYSITTGLSYTPTILVYGMGASPNQNTVSLAGGSSSTQQGIIYAVNGDISVAGGSTFTGALMAGGAGGDIKASGGYTQSFPTGMAATYSYPTGAHVQRMAEY